MHEDHNNKNYMEKESEWSSVNTQFLVNVQSSTATQQWQKTFKDSSEDILIYLNNVKYIR